jgi:diacylglycerol kinase (ATP)
VRIGVLNNLRAGHSGRRVSGLLSVLRRYPEVLHIETDSAHTLSETLAEITHEEIDLLILNGGDGTLQHALTELLSDRGVERLPWIAPLRGGRTNMTALDLGVRRDPVSGLESLLYTAREGRIEELRVERPVLRIASSRGGPDQYGMFFGVGMIRRAIDLTHRVFPTGRSQGVFGASLVTGALIAKALARPTRGILTPDKLQIAIDDRPVPDGEFYLAIASSLRRLFMGMNPFWGSGPGGVRFTAIASAAQGLGPKVLGILRGKPGRKVTQQNGFNSANADRVEIRLDCGYTVDGETFAPVADERVAVTADRRITFVRA